MGRKTALRGFDVTFFDVGWNGASHRVQVKRVATARRFTLRVRAATRDAVLTMPTLGSMARAKNFVERHAEWIGSRLERLPAHTRLGPGETVPLRGIAHTIVHRPDIRGTVWIDAMAAPPTPLLCVGGDAPFVARRVKDFLTLQARSDLADAVARHAATLDVKVKRITLRDTTSRWGSCSSAGALNFSWRLILAPPHVLDYLAAHEVAHLRHMNHSAAFWAVTERLVPDYERAEAWLKANGSGLMRYSAR